MKINPTDITFFQYSAVLVFFLRLNTCIVNQKQLDYY